MPLPEKRETPSPSNQAGSKPAENKVLEEKPTERMETSSTSSETIAGPEETPVEEEAGTYIVKKGESLSAIADKFNVPLPALLLWNRLDTSRPIHPGDRLIVAPAN